MPDNQQRADRAEDVLQYYHAHYGEGDTFTESVVTDLLTDLRHHCHKMGWDVQQFISTSEIAFNEEEEDA